MDEENQVRKLRATRRQFLKTAGVISAGFVLGPVLDRAGASHAAERGAVTMERQLLLGVMLPRSSVYPELATGYLTGLDLALGGVRTPAGAGVKLITANIGSGASARAQADHLAARDADLAVALTIPGVAADIQDRLSGSGIPLLSTGLGENLTRDADRRAGLYSHSLGHWLGAYRLGYWAAQSVGRRAFLASSCYDSGYDAPYMFRLGFEGGGGEVVASRVTHLPEQPGNVSQAIEDIKTTRPDLVYAAYNGRPAVDFVRAYGAAGLRRTIPLLGSAFLTDRSILGAQGDDAVGIRTASALASGLRRPAYAAFEAAYRRRIKLIPDELALLGYETGQLIAAGLASGGKFDPGRFTAALSRAVVQSPRGTVAMSPTSHTTTGPLFLRQVEVHGGAVRNGLIGTLSQPEEPHNPVTALQASVRTGWLNAYLCI